MKEIPVGNGLFALVDDEDYTFLSTYKWIVERGYAVWPGSKFKMHQLIMGKAPPNHVIDHINRNRLDNRKCNLRFVTLTVNARNKNPHSNNKSGYRGVYQRKDKKRWIAKIGVGGKRIMLGEFLNKDDAARAYDYAALQHFGSEAQLNHPPPVF